MQQGYDQPVLGRQLGDEFGHQFLGKIEIVISRSVNLGGGELLDSGGDFFVEIAEPPFRTNLSAFSALRQVLTAIREIQCSSGMRPVYWLSL